MSKVKVFTKSYMERMFNESQVDPFSYVRDVRVFDKQCFASGITGLELSEELTSSVNNAYTSKDDCKNAIRLFEGLKLTPTMASDSRLWVCLTHTHFWPYMLKRWPIEELELKNAKTRIRDRYHLRALSLNNLARNGVGRLWWIAHLTFDESREDVYELTRTLASSADLIAGLLERLIGSSSDIRRAVLEFLIENKDILESQERRRALLKKINLMGGVRNLPHLEWREIKNEIESLTI